IEPEAAAERMGKRGQSNYLDEENQQFHQRVRQTYLSRAHKEPDRYVVLDASVGADELTARILEAIRRRLPQTLAGRDSTPAAPAARGVPRPRPAVTAPAPRGHWQTPVGPLRPMTLPLETPPSPEPLPDRPPRVLLPGRLPRARMLRTAVRLLPAQIPLMITA